MSSQKEIAKALGITQAAVSRALRGDRLISAEMRQKVHHTAECMGYQLNPHVSNLMSNIRTGKKLHDKGTIGLLIDARSQKEWYEDEIFQRFHRGVLQRSEELGFRIESFFLQKLNVRPSRIDQILHSRGIIGVILAPPGYSKKPPELQWEHYAMINASVGWEDKVFNRVCCDQLQNYITAFNELQRMGYRRIGTTLRKKFMQGSRQRTKWYTGYLDCQNDLPENDRIPIHAHNHPPPGKLLSENENRILYDDFRKWFLQWRPEVVLTLIGEEKKWLIEMNLRIPQDVGIACFAQHSEDNFSGIDEMCEVYGATAIEQVSAQIARNEFGPPSYPKVMMIAGQWRDGATVQNKN